MSKRTKGKKLVLLIGIVVAVLLVGSVWLSWDHLRFWYFFESLGKNEQGYLEYPHRHTEIVFVRLPGGQFWMGTSQEEGEKVIQEALIAVSGSSKRQRTEWIATQQPYHEVTLSPFLIAKYEVNQAEWERVTGTNPSVLTADDLPVEQVSWEDCQEFCELTGLRLPSEAQWEYACRAGTSTRFAFGDKLTRKQANFTLSRRRTVAVHSYEPNGFGLYSVHGNVWEWCEDVYDPEFYRKPQASHRDPLCNSGFWAGRRMVRRGGSYHNVSSNCRSGERGSGDLKFRGDVGFRPAYYPPP